MSDPADFTILVPVWRGDTSAYLETTMQSLARSTHRPADVVICQDGDLPPDLADVVAAAAANLNARVALNPGPPGLARNLNHAMDAVRTGWVARIDADDVNLPDRFAAQIAYLRRHPDVAAVGGGIVEFAPDATRRRKPMPLDHDAIVRRARWRNPINHMTAFFRVDVFRACGGYPLIPLKEDYGLWLTMIARGYRLANLDQDLVDARLGANFHARRAGFSHLASEFALWSLKRRIPAIGAGAATAAWLARSGALAFEAPARLIYERVLRR